MDLQTYVCVYTHTHTRTYARVREFVCGLVLVRTLVYTYARVLILSHFS